MKNLLSELGELITKSSNLDPIAYQYFLNLKNRKIIINDDISQDTLEYAVLPLIEMDNDGTDEPIEIILNSLGGEVYNGFSLISQIENLKTKTTIRIMGYACSMGILIAMSGKNNPNVKVVCDKFSVGLIHSGSQCMEGSAHAVRDTFKFTEKYESRIKSYVLSHTKISEELYDKIERQEFWMDSDDMLLFGIVDEIL